MTFSLNPSALKNFLSIMTKLILSLILAVNASMSPTSSGVRIPSPSSAFEVFASRRSSPSVAFAPSSQSFVPVAAASSAFDQGTSQPAPLVASTVVEAAFQPPVDEMRLLVKRKAQSDSSEAPVGKTNQSKNAGK